jgi:hypothetical protein
VVKARACLCGRGVGRRIVCDQPPLFRLLERGVKETVDVHYALPRQWSWRGAVRLAAVRQQLGVERIKVARGELLEQDVPAVPRRQADIPLITLQRRRCEVPALAVVRQPSTQVSGEIMPLWVADAAAFDLAHPRGVRRRFLPGREVL